MRAADARRVEVERAHALGAQAHRGEREEPAAAADVEEGAPVQVLDAEHRSQRALGLHDPLLVEDRQEAAPVVAELEALARGDLRRAASG